MFYIHFSHVSMYIQYRSLLCVYLHCYTYINIPNNTRNGSLNRASNLEYDVQPEPCHMALPAENELMHDYMI